MITKKQFLDAGKFFLLLIIFFIAFVIVSSFFPENFFEKKTAQASNTAYSLIGINGTIETQGKEIFIRIKNGPNIFFSSLCTGLLETILLLAAIAATFEMPWKKRAIGIIAGAITVFLLNILRITITTLTILNAGIETADFVHNILFRIFLFVAIAGLFAGWYRWATIEQNETSEKTAMV